MKRLRKLIAKILIFTAVAAGLLLNVSAAPIACGAGTVSATTLNVRNSASMSGAVIATLRMNDTVVIQEKVNNDWYRINCNGTLGYVAARYLSDVQTAKNFSAAGTVSGSDVRIRTSPSTSGAVLGTYSAGTNMEVVGINNGWYKVKYNGLTGYIRSDYFKLTAANNPSATSFSSACASTAGQKIADLARQYIGSDYVYGAASPKTGFDCSGLTYYVYRHFGFSICRTASQQYKNNGVSVSKANLLPGDLVFFSSNGGKSVTHVGLYIGGGKFVNASTSSTGVILSSLSSSWYTRTWYGAKRIARDRKSVV